MHHPTHTHRGSSSHGPQLDRAVRPRAHNPIVGHKTHGRHAPLVCPFQRRAVARSPRNVPHNDPRVQRARHQFFRVVAPRQRRDPPLVKDHARVRHRLCSGIPDDDVLGAVTRCEHGATGGVGDASDAALVVVEDGAWGELVGREGEDVDGVVVSTDGNLSARRRDGDPQGGKDNRRRAGDLPISSPGALEDQDRLVGGDEEGVGVPGERHARGLTPQGEGLGGVGHVDEGGDPEGVVQGA
mmetsp:Transcript_25080/g.63308  ORF Transcript_25080/g.63308 Transcript_25080/m.63308 type:complete len:241 (+) Transcript_25080:264-986(+)